MPFVILQLQIRVAWGSAPHHPGMIRPITCEVGTVANAVPGHGPPAWQAGSVRIRLPGAENLTALAFMSSLLRKR
jgi:hypothetical protein